jgi:YD repeat-containing protein
MTQREKTLAVFAANRRQLAVYRPSADSTLRMLASSVRADEGHVVGMCLCIRQCLVHLTAFACVLLVITTSATGQTDPPDPVFDAEGFQNNRAYFSQLPFEYIDTMTGNVILTFTDLVLPGNAGFDLRIQRTYNTKHLVRWTFGVAGIPLRVIHPNGPAAGELTPHPSLKTADGASHETMLLNSGNSSVYVTKEFWKYTITNRRLELPNGVRCDYDTSGFLTQATDPFENTLSFEWITISTAGSSATVLHTITQSVGNNQRLVIFSYDEDSGSHPAKMEYIGREWTYTYTAPSWGTGARMLTRVTPPQGSDWQYAYSDADHTTVTTPARGTITYITQVHPELVTPRSGGLNIANTRMITTRITGGAGIASGMWTYAFDGGNDGTTVAGPEGVVVKYVHDDFGEDGGAFLITRRTGYMSGSSFVADEVETRSYASRPYTNSGATQRLLATKDISRGGHTYSTAFDYSQNNYGDFGRAYSIIEIGDVRRTTIREFDDEFYVYIHDKVKRETIYSVALINGVWSAVNPVARSYEYENETGFKIDETLYSVHTQFEHDNYGNVAIGRDDHGHVTGLTYDWGAVKNTTTEVYTVSREVNPDGTVASETRGGGTTGYSYDDLGRATWLKPPEGHWFQTTYDNTNGSWIKVQRSDGNQGGKTSWTTYSLDGFGRLIGTLDSVGVKTSQRYDAIGRKTFESMPYLLTAEVGTSRTFDTLDRPREQTQSGGQQTTFTYSNGVDVAIVEANGDEPSRATQQNWDSFGDPSASQLTSLTDALGNTWAYEYNTLGRLTKVTQPPAQPGEGTSVRTWSYYAGTDLLASETHPESGTTTFAYDNAGRLQSKTTPAPGGVFLFGYDNNDRLKFVTAPSAEHSLTMDYDDSDNRKLLSNSFVTSTFDFDHANRLRWRRDAFAGQPVRQTTYTPDAWDNIYKIDYPSGRSVRYEYDSEKSRYECISLGWRKLATRGRG